MNFKYLIKSQKGTSIVLFALVFTVLAGCAALVFDIGIVVIEKAKTQNACDAAALAGINELGSNPDNALSVAQTYLTANGIQLSEATVSISGDNKSITVTSTRNVNYVFAKILGFNNQNVIATSVAKIAPISGVLTGVRPFGIADQTLVYGQQYILKNGAGNGNNGNYGLLALCGNGANAVSNNILNGYNGSLNVGDSIDTEPGNETDPVTSSVQALINQDPSSTFNNFQPNSPRIITVIIVDTLNVNGRKPVTIRGFTSFFLENIDNSGGHAQVTGRFIKRFIDGITSDTQTNYGLVSGKLVQ